MKINNPLLLSDQQNMNYDCVQLSFPYFQKEGI